MAGRGSPADREDAHKGSGWSERIRAAVLAGLRSRCAQLEQAIYEQVDRRVPELMLDGDAQRQARARTTIAALARHCLDAIERGPEHTPQPPQAILEWARGAARAGASIGPLLRAIQAGYQPFVGFVIAEAQRLPQSVLVREHLRENYGGLLGDITAAVEREYERERALHPPAPERDGAARSLDVAAILTRRELEVHGMLLDGLSYKEVAQALHVTQNTVHTHASHIFRKLEVKGRSELMGW